MDAILNADQQAQLAGLGSQLTPAQSLWASGYLAGSGGSVATGAAPAVASPPAGAPAPVAAAAALPVTIYYGTESGNSESLADESKRKLAAAGFAPKVINLADIKPSDLSKDKHILVIISTWGDGDAPDAAVDFHAAFMGKSAPKLDGLKFSVCGLGDTSYDKFCEIGKQFDSRLEALGATRIADRVDCDVDFESTYEAWLASAIDALNADKPAAAPAQSAAVAAPMAMAAAASVAAVPAPTKSIYTKSNPFAATLTESILLNGRHSAKETFHFEISLAGSDLVYQPGDALAVIPENAKDVVDAVLKAAGLKGSAKVKSDDGDKKLRDLLTKELDCTTVSKNVLKKWNAFADSKKLGKLLENPKKLSDYLWGRQIVDMLEDFPVKKLKAKDLCSVLRKLPPRLYSIASSLRAHPEQVDLTIATVRYHAHGRDRKGVASTYLADDLKVGDKVHVYLHVNKNFKLPANPNTPIIMVGPGTGVAPFRAFLEERAATSAEGANWLFFGDQHYTEDFLYQLEFQNYLKDGVLDRLDVAFSRDQADKVYVQHKMLEQGEEIYQWLESGAHFYVCGDAERMAGDVHEALISIISEYGNRPPSSAEAYLAKLKKDRRYQRDVY